MLQLTNPPFLRNLRTSPLAQLFRVNTGSLQGRLLYDKNGNLVGNTINNKRQFEYTYDAQNRLINVSRYNEINQKEVLISFQYDALGRRTNKKVANVLYEYIYSGNDIIEETQSTVNPNNGIKVKKESREYTYGARGTDDIIHTKYSTYIRQNKQDILSTTGNYYYEKNHLGSVIRIKSSTGGIIDEYSYTVFGKAYRKNLNGLYKPVTGTNDSPIGNTRLYIGREYDKEIFLYYLRARYYDAHLGRFVSRDPIGMSDNVNLYTYVGNSPVIYKDPTGTVKIVLQETGERLLSWTAQALLIVFSPNTANAPGDSTYDTDMAQGNLFQENIDSPSLPVMAITIFLPLPGGGKKKLADGAVMKVDDALTAAEDFLGKGYKELSSGRFVSEVEGGFRQVRMGLDDILGKHGGGPHINFETLDANGKLIPESKIHIFLNQ